MDATSGTLDEALLRLHTSGPEFNGYLSNHGPMAVEAMVRNGQAHTVHRWLDGYENKLEGVPRAHGRLTDANWREALGDASRVTDWTAYFSHQVAERPWRELLAVWWPRLLPGIAGAATHPAIRVGHAVRSLLTEGEDTARLAEFAHALGYWAARHLLLPVAVRPAGGATPSEALAALPRIAEQHVTPENGYSQLPATPGWLSTTESLHLPDDPEAVREGLTALVRAATLNYANYGHGNGIMLVHAATAPNAVLRTLPALPGSCGRTRSRWPGRRPRRSPRSTPRTPRSRHRTPPRSHPRRSSSERSPTATSMRSSSRTPLWTWRRPPRTATPAPCRRP